MTGNMITRKAVWVENSFERRQKKISVKISNMSVIKTNYLLRFQLNEKLHSIKRQPPIRLFRSIDFSEKVTFIFIEFEKRRDVTFLIFHFLFTRSIVCSGILVTNAKFNSGLNEFLLMHCVLEGYPTHMTNIFLLSCCNYEWFYLNVCLNVICRYVCNGCILFECISIWLNLWYISFLGLVWFVILFTWGLFKRFHDAIT